MFPGEQVLFIKSNLNKVFKDLKDLYIFGRTWYQNFLFDDLWLSRFQVFFAKWLMQLMNLVLVIVVMKVKVFSLSLTWCKQAPIYTNHAINVHELLLDFLLDVFSEFISKITTSHSLNWYNFFTFWWCFDLQLVIQPK